MAEKKVVDIAGPEEAKVDIGSKPMIVGHKSLASDPMVRETPPVDTEPVSGEAAPSTTPVNTQAKEPSQQKIIEPITATKVPAEEANPESDTKKAPETESVPKTDEVKKPEEKPEETKSEGVVLKEDPAKKENDAAVAAMEKEQELQKLIASKKYRVSIKQARGSNKMLFYALMCVLVGLFAALYLLVDAGKLNVGFDVPVSIINEAKTDTTETVAPVATKVEEKVTEDTPDTSEEVSSKNWYVFDNPDYSMRVPDGWILSKKEASKSSVFSTHAVYKAGEKGVVEEYSEAENIQAEQNVFVVDVTPQTDAEYCSKNFVEGDVSTLKTENSLTIYKKLTLGTAGETVAEYCIQAEDKTFQTSYTLYKGESDQSVYAEKAVISIKPR